MEYLVITLVFVDLMVHAYQIIPVSVTQITWVISVKLHYAMVFLQLIT